MKKQRRDKLRAEGGFSLMEMVVGMTVTMVILGGVATLIVGMNGQLRNQKARMSNVENAQFAADTMARIIRMSGAKSNTCLSTFTVAPPSMSGSLSNNYYSQLTINADWNPADCALTGTEENVTFSVANGNFYEDSGQAVPLVDGLSAVRFQFYDKSGNLMTNPSAAPSSIGYIRIEVDTTAVGGGSITVVSGAAIRN